MAQEGKVVTKSRVANAFNMPAGAQLSLSSLEMVRLKKCSDMQTACTVSQPVDCLTPALAWLHAGG